MSASSSITTDPSPTPNCGNLAFPLSCPLPLPLPTDGHGGPCYIIPFPVPTCNNQNDPTTSSNSYDDPNGAISPQLTWQLLDNYYASNASIAMLQGIALGMMIVVLVYILTVTPPRKKKLPVFWAVLVAVTGQVGRCTLAAWMSVYGGRVSAYLQLTGDWGGTEWSSTWKAVVTGQEVLAVIVVGAAHMAFWWQCRALLVGVRVKFGRGWYRAVLGLLSGLAIMGWLSVVVVAVWDVYHAGFVVGGFSWGGVWDAALFIRMMGRVCLGVAFGGWSLVFVASAGWMLWERRRGWLSKGFGMNQEKTVKSKVGGICERALDLVVLVGVQSFSIPLVLSIVTAVGTNTLTEVFLMPVILASLPLSSLLIQGAEGSEPRQQHQQQRQTVRGLQFEMISKSKPVKNTTVPVCQTTGIAERKAGPSHSSRQEVSGSVDILSDRELHEIDSIR